MNKEEFIVDEKIYENHEGLAIRIVFSNLGRRYKQIKDKLSSAIVRPIVIACSIYRGVNPQK